MIFKASVKSKACIISQIYLWMSKLCKTDNTVYIPVERICLLEICDPRRQSIRKPLTLHLMMGLSSQATSIPGKPLTVPLGGHNWNLLKIRFALIFVLIIKSFHNFAHATTAKLLSEQDAFLRFGSWIMNSKQLRETGPPILDPHNTVLAGCPPDVWSCNPNRYICVGQLHDSRSVTRLRHP